MAVGTFVGTSLKRKYAENYAGLNPPSETETRLCFLTQGSAVSASSSKAQLIAAECIPTTANGYNRKILGSVVSAMDTGTETLTSTAHGNANGVTGYLAVSTGGSLPGGYTADTEVFVINSAANTFQLSLTSGGSALNFTSAGSGTIVFIPSGSYNATNKRLENSISIVLTANTDLIQHQGYFILRGSTAASSLLISSIDAGSNLISTPTHSLTTGDEVVITADDGATQPSGVSATTVYFARAVSFTTLSLHPTAADAIANTNTVDITSAGSGSLRLRYAAGLVDAVNYYTTPADINPGQAQTFVLTFYRPNTGAAVGV